jgi:hypothetical protein
MTSLAGGGAVMAADTAVLPQDDPPIERPRSVAKSAKSAKGADTASDAARERGDAGEAGDTGEREDSAASAAAAGRDRRRGDTAKTVERALEQVDEARREALLRVSSGGARVRIGGKVFVREDERVGKAVAIFGRAEVNGIVSEEVVAIGGDVVLGPKAIVRGDVVSIGGVVRAAPGAYIGGTTGQVNMSPSDFKVMLPDDGEMSVAIRPDWPQIARIGFVTGAMRYLFWFVVCALLIAAAPRGVGRARERAGASPITAFAVGLLAEALIVPIVVILAVVLSISVIGIPLLALLPVLLLAFALAMAVGFTGVASGLGSRLVGRATPIGALVLGLALIWGVGMAGHWLWTMSRGALGVGVMLMAMGFFIEYLACTLGLGAALLSWSANRRRRQAPAAAERPVESADPLPQQL